MYDKDDNVGTGLPGYEAEEVRKGLLKGTAMAFLAFALLKGDAGDVVYELFELVLLAVFGSQQAFNTICRIIKRRR
jgi:hypothetical protein